MNSEHRRARFAGVLFRCTRLTAGWKTLLSLWIRRKPSTNICSKITFVNIVALSLFHWFLVLPSLYTSDFCLYLCCSTISSRPFHLCLCLHCALLLVQVLLLFHRVYSTLFINPDRLTIIHAQSIAHRSHLYSQLSSSLNSAPFSKSNGPHFVLTILHLE